MSSSIGNADRYINTFLDFWWLRPRKFIAAKNRDPSRYQSPYQFLVASLKIAFGVYIAIFIVSQSMILETTGQSHVTPPGDHAYIYIVLMIVPAMLFANSLILRAISRIWPVRGCATFSSIFELQCYTLAIRLPAIALLLITPLFMKYQEHGILPALDITLIFMILHTVDVVIGVASLLFWDLPGAAAVNGVSTPRMWAGLLFWPAVLGFVGGIVLGVLSALR